MADTARNVSSSLINPELDPVMAMWTDFFGPAWVKVLFGLSYFVCLGPGLYLLGFLVWYAREAR